MLEGRVVKVKDLETLCYFYPEFVVKDKISILDRESNVIYNGKIKPGLKEMLSKSTRNYISVVGAPDIDLTNREVMLEFVYSKHGKKPTKAVMEWLKDIDWDEFMYYCKIIWVLGKLKAEDDSKSSTMFDLFSGSYGATLDLIRTFFSLVETTPAEILESGYITFLSRVAEADDQVVSSGYAKVIQGVKTRGKDTIKPSLISYIKMRNMRADVRLMKLIMNIRGV